MKAKAKYLDKEVEFEGKVIDDILPDRRGTDRQNTVELYGQGIYRYVNCKEDR